jgi:hypothetical protein
MGMIDVPAIHYNLKGSGRVSINRGPNMQLMPHLLIIVPPNTPFSIEVDGGDGATRLINRDCWKRDVETARAGSKPRELVHTRRCDPTELFPVLSQIRARLAH